MAENGNISSQRNDRQGDGQRFASIPLTIIALTKFVWENAFPDFIPVPFIPLADSLIQFGGSCVLLRLIGARFSCLAPV